MDLIKEINELYPQIVEWRRDFHRHPELGHHEERTSAIVAAHLRALGLEVQEHVGDYGVIGLLRGGKPGKNLALRADMDALPLHEQTGLPYSSETDGVMHACGHDGNTAMLMGAAAILARHREQIKGTVKFIFQPAEEGGRGAAMMIENGALENPRPDAIIGNHLFFWDAGTITIRKGFAFLGSDVFKITVHGKGGHGAKPHECNDTLVAACEIVTTLQTIVSRKISPLEMATVTVGVIQSGTKENIIPAEAEIRGTVRTLKPEVQERVIQGIKEICSGICTAMGTTYELEYTKQFGPVYNDEKIMDCIADACAKVMEPEMLRTADESRAGSEDFSDYLATGIPGGYIWLGGKYPEEAVASQNHQPTYNWDEEAMRNGVLAEVASTFEFLDCWE